MCYIIVQELSTNIMPNNDFTIMSELEKLQERKKLTDRVWNIKAGFIELGIKPTHALQSHFLDFYNNHKLRLYDVLRPSPSLEVEEDILIIEKLEETLQKFA